MTAGLDLAAVVPWLQANGVDLVGPVTATLFPGGRSNVTFLLEDGEGTRVVLRRPPLGNVLPSGHDMGREHRILSGLALADYPAPRPLAICRDETVNGSVFLVMQYVEGRILRSSRDTAGLTAERAAGISAALVDRLADLHDVDVVASGLDGLGRPAGYLPRQLERWTAQWEITKTRDLPAMARLHDQVERLLAPLPHDLPWSLVHGDFRLDNVVLDADRDDVIAVLDWEMSTLGDPLADLALALVYWTDPEDGLRSSVPVAERLTAGDGFWSRAALIEHYAQRSGRPLDHLDACVTLACFKLAVITESILARALTGKQLGAGADEIDAMRAATEALANLGLAVSELGTVSGLAA